MNMTDPLTSLGQSFYGHPLVLFLIALGGIFIVIGYSISFFKFVYDYSQRDKAKAKQEYLDHCDSLFKQFSMAMDRTRILLDGSSWESFFNIFSYKDQTLRHLFTGYDEVFNSLTSMINIDRQIRTGREPASKEQREESNIIHAEFKTAFENFTKSIILKEKTFVGVCDICRDNYEKAYKTTVMSDKLKSFSGIL
jgi:hypothetical protein